jgi:hypothetical protein
MLAEHVLMLLYHPVTGRPLVSSSKADLALGGALLVELAGRRRIDLKEPHWLTRNRTVVVVDRTPTGDEVLDEALRRISAQRSARAHVVVSKIAKGVRGRLLKRLAEQGILKSEQRKLVGVIPADAWPAVDVQRAEEHRRGLRQVLAQQRPPTRQEAAVISLLHTVGATVKALGGAGLERRGLKQRARTITKADAAAAIVNQALKAAAF